MLEIVSFTLGPAQTNAYLVADPETKEAVVIDPSWDGHIILKAAQDRGWRIGHLWYTHAHFDHIGGAAEIADALNPLPHVALHPDDHVLWRAGGGGAIFGFDIDPGPEPTIDFSHGQILKLGSNEFEVRYTPGIQKVIVCFMSPIFALSGVRMHTVEAFVFAATLFSTEAWGALTCPAAIGILWKTV